MTLLRLSSQALSRSRFALSPLAETLAAVRVLDGPTADPWLVRWHAEHAPALAAALAADPFARGFVTLLHAGKWLPWLVTHPPRGGMSTTLTDELAVVAATPDDVVRADLGEAREKVGAPELHWLVGRDLGPRVATLLQRVWAEHVQPDWPRRRAVLERDITYRAGLLAAHGWPRALEKMSRRSAWLGADTIRFTDQPGADRMVGTDGMAFVPVSLSAGTWLCEDPHGLYALVYPARGIAAVEPATAPEALDRLLGAGRARLLHELVRPATSTELSHALAVSLGTVGGHLGVLRDAGMIEGRRAGRRVVYRRTQLGEAVVARAGSGAG